MTAPGDTRQTWTPSLDTFGARLAAIRQKLGWNVKEAAVACGLPPENWRRWEQENIEPRRLVTIAMAIATRTGVDADWLIRGPKPTGANPPDYKNHRVDPLEQRLVATVGEVRHLDRRRRTRSAAPSRRGVAARV